MRVPAGGGLLISPTLRSNFLSHLPILSAACQVTEGPVLELGAGFASTYALHGICGHRKLRLLTIESNKTWLNCFQYYQRTWHTFKHVTTFVDLPEYKEQWGMAFVDHGINGQRGISLAALVDVPIVVAHDTCHEDLNYYNKGKPRPLTLYKYRYDYQWFGPQTSVLSNSLDVKKIFQEMEL